MTALYELADPPPAGLLAEIADRWRTYRSWASVLIRVWWEDTTSEIAGGHRRTPQGVGVLAHGPPSPHVDRPAVGNAIDVVGVGIGRCPKLSEPRPTLACMFESTGWSAEEAFGVCAVLPPVGGDVASVLAELAVGQARQLTVTGLVAVPTLGVAWGIVWGGSRQVGPATPVMAALNGLTDALAAGTAAACLLGFGFLVTVAHRLARPERLTLVLVLITLAGVAGTMLSSLAMVVLDPVGNPAVIGGSASGRAVGVGTVLAAVWLIVLGIRGIRSSRMDPG